mgnify:CR=1 FL=1
MASRSFFRKRHSPVLFPIVGSVWENEYRIDGATYNLTQHGFARDMNFELIREQPDELRYRLADMKKAGGDILSLFVLK